VKNARTASPTLTAIVIGVVAAGIIMAGFGIWLVYLGKHGQETVSIFGQRLNASTTGILAIFIGGVTIGAGGIVRGMGSKPS
jgi:hypothetical protein